MTVLVVDDDPAFARLMRKSIPGVVMEAETIADGISVAAGFQPAVIVIDQRFGPGMDTGVESIELFRAVSPRSQYVVVSSDYDGKAAKRAVKIGAVGFTTKGDVRLIRALVLAARARVQTIFCEISSRLQ